MDKPCLLAFVEDLYFQSQIEGVAQSKKIDCYFATQGEQLSQLAKTFAPFMLVVDLSGLESEWLFRHIAQIRTMEPDFPIVAFVSHIQEDVRERAERCGCDSIFTKSELIQKLPETIECALRGSL